MALARLAQPAASLDEPAVGELVEIACGASGVRFRLRAPVRGRARAAASSRKHCGARVFGASASASNLRRCAALLSRRKPRAVDT